MTAAARQKAKRSGLRARLSLFQGADTVFVPAAVHYGKVETIAARRDTVLGQAFRDHPERFINGAPRADRPAPAAYINQPADNQSAL